MRASHNSRQGAKLGVASWPESSPGGLVEVDCSRRWVWGAAGEARGEEGCGVCRHPTRAQQR
jgi:hypothetical protein